MWLRSFGRGRCLSGLGNGIGSGGKTDRHSPTFPLKPHVFLICLHEKLAESYYLSLPGCPGRVREKLERPAIRHDGGRRRSRHAGADHTSAG